MGAALLRPSLPGRKILRSYFPHNIPKSFASQHPFAYHSFVRVLIAEDDPGVQRFVAKGLKEQAYAVDTVSTGDEALEQAEINTYDLIILDVMLPGLSGFEVCRRLRENGQRVPVLML